MNSAPHFRGFHLFPKGSDEYRADWLIARVDEDPRHHSALIAMPVAYRRRSARRVRGGLPARVRAGAREGPRARGEVHARDRRERTDARGGPDSRVPARAQVGRRSLRSRLHRHEGRGRDPAPRGLEVMSGYALPGGARRGDSVAAPSALAPEFLEALRGPRGPDDVAEARHEPVLSEHPDVVLNLGHAVEVRRERVELDEVAPLEQLVEDRALGSVGLRWAGGHRASVHEQVFVLLPIRARSTVRVDKQTRDRPGAGTSTGP